jgi:cysteine desulfurase
MADAGRRLVTAQIYLDHAATTPLDSSVFAAMQPFLSDVFGNPSSVHAEGRAARNAVDDARDRLAAVLHCAQRELIFTGSGSEADNLALRGALERWGTERGRHIVVSAIEHDAILETARRLQDTGAADLTIVGCDQGCRVDPDEVATAVRPDTVIVSVMLVNNETGVIQDVAAVAQAVHARNPRALVHTDAVQALGRLPLDVQSLEVDLASVSAHKLYGPKGVGALWVRHGVLLSAQVTGGGQERNRRSGTENVAGIAGLAAAAELAAARRSAEQPRQAALCARLRDTIAGAVTDVVFTGDDNHRAPGFVSCAFLDVRTDLLLAVLDGDGVFASGGSACSSGAPTPSHVLLAMGLDPGLATGALRLTTGVGTTETDVATAGAAIANAVTQLRAAREPAGLRRSG